MRSTAEIIQEQHPLGPLTNWQVGGPAAFYAEPADPEELALCLRFGRDKGLSILAMGGGSNLLIAESGYPGLVIRYADRRIDLEDLGDSAKLRAGAGCLLAPTAMRMAALGWAGLEWAAGVPGTIGGAIVGNAGAYGGDTARNIESVEVFSLEEGRQWIPAAECGFDYRESRFKGQDTTRTFVLTGLFTLSKDDPKALGEFVRQINARRKDRTPPGCSAGSVFKGPPGDSAGRLIESVGLKGASCGPAQISEVHANFIINNGGCSADQILELIRLARNRVLEQTGIRLELEVRLIGFDPEKVRDFRPAPGI